MQHIIRLLVFLNQPNIFRATPPLLPTGATVVPPVGSRGGALYQKLYIQSKIAPDDGRICRSKHVGLI